ncbi:hypothetical protein MWU52_07500 [Jannaschia sp. S6380]|uniref:hypothetical protein n=1 Tax=Jannaschia sp. S6380 TaxID=2926408 RepID=UPI001FF4084A|nr:hypothetical protein [Jannaschia sp. S6380]MCK0167390.1 hypothetical protein [Jannaschia sp. S6380]
MTVQMDHIRKFARGEHGALTVEYVLLAFLATIIGVLSFDKVSFGMHSLSHTVDEELRGQDPDAFIGVRYSNRFDNGAEGWVGATAWEDKNGQGWVLGPIENTGGGPAVNRDFAIDEEAGQATFSFDLLAMDDLDGDTGTIFIDGEAVGTVTVEEGGVQTFTAASDLEERGITIRFTEFDSGVPLGGGPEADARSNIEIFVDNPGDTVNFGFGSDASAGASDEFFAIDNFEATGLADTSNTSTPSG